MKYNGGKIQIRITAVNELDLLEEELMGAPESWDWRCVACRTQRVFKCYIKGIGLSPRDNKESLKV